ncbi:MAG: hypothetical protein OEY84_04105 [Rhodospirillaceae bacterium]|nr:hypothetical protein [Rhodospirillaceae bacterium]
MTRKLSAKKIIRVIAFIGGSILSAMMAVNAYADVDIYNKDSISYVVNISLNGGKASRNLAPGSSWKKVCVKCKVAVQPVNGTHWHESIEASGNDVVTISNGTVHIGTY